MDSTPFAPIVRALRTRAEREAEREALTFLTGGADNAGVTLSYGELDARARAFAAVLQGAGAAHRRALLLFSPGVDYVVGFLGCLYAGVVAVPAYPPGPARANRHLARLQAVIADADAELVLATRSIAEIAASDALARRGGRLHWVVAENVDIGAADTWRPPGEPAEPIAFLQYSSGSTGDPKGIIVSHASLAANLAAIERSFEIRRDDTAVLWLPPYHDMGLIGGILSPLWSGYRVVLLPPGSFLQRPLGWLRAITRHGGTIAGGPNFAFELCARRATPADLAGLDLSRWQVAFSGAEPIRAATLERFADVFAPCGFDRRAFYACYGLAEATLLVTGSRRGIPPRVRELDRGALESGRARDADAPGRAGVAAVGCGRAPEGHEIAVVAPEARVRVPPGEIGEIWVRGPSVARGYWGQPALAAQVFEATIAGEPDQRYLRTGDLGFIADGELFVTGRIKDLLILRGRNVYPQDVELTVEQADPAIRFGGCAAFGIEVNGEERLAIAAETDLRRGSDDAAVQRVIEAVRCAVADQHSVEVHAVVLVAARSMPKTSSGKIQRRACRAAYLANELDTIASSVASAETEEVIAGIWAEVLGQPQIGAEDNFFDLGGHSLLATQVVARVHSALGVELPLRALFEDASVTRLARRIAAARAGDADGDPSRALDAIEAAPPLRPRPPGTVDRLSFAQQRLWFLDQLTPGSAAYNIPGAVRMRGPLDVGALERSFVEIVRRHAALRTRIATVDGEPQPVVVVDPAFAIAVTEAADEAEIAALAVIEARRPFDLSAGEPLLRARLVRLAADHHVLLLTMHHIASDGWSLGVLIREAAALYAAFTRGQPSPLPPLAIQYADYAAWQRGWLDGPVLERQLAYWRGQLADAPAALDLPTDRPRTATPAHRGAQVPVALPPAVVAPLIALARREGATLYMALLAAFHALLARYTGQTDILVGSPIAGRRRLEFEGLIGFFVNTLVMRGDVSGAPSFRALLGRTRRVALDAYAHQDVPFEKLVEDLAPARDLGRTPLFQVMFILQNAPVPALDLAGVALEPVILDTGTAKFELTLSLESAPDGGLRGFLEYDADLFDAATARRLVTHYAALVQAVGAAPDLPLPEVSLLSADERAHLLALAGDPATAPPATTLHALFDAQVARTPDAPALITDDGALSYAQLAHRASQLAHQLQELGVAPGDIVGIALARSPDAIAAMLAIVRLGAAYLPLDPRGPRARLAMLLDDARVRVAITRSRDTGELPAPLTLLRVDEPPPIAPVLPPVSVTADHLAYVMFTSGSTGRPKGVAITHRGVVRLALDTSYMSLAPGDVMLQFAPLWFDASTFEIWIPLLRGAAVACARPGELSLAEIAGELRALRVTTCLLMAPLFHQFVAEHLEGLAGLRHLIAGGDTLSPRAVQRVRAALPAVRLIDAYGPTENTVLATCEVVTTADGIGRISIGRPIDGTRVYVLDERLAPQPIGAVGEIYAAGAGLARGYLGDPQRTAASFLPDPFGPPGARMYRTGDLGRWLPDGRLDFLGRRDHQIKVRGFRIELGEIEATLLRHPDVREAAVIAHDDGDGQGGDARSLCGYVVAARPVAPDALRAHLAATLPPHMVPPWIVVLDELPLTDRGKIDRARLPSPRVAQAAARGPATATERRLARIWAEVLALDPHEVDIGQSFFEAGGHSLAAMRLAAAIERDLGRQLSLVELFRAPTLCDLARILEDGERRDAVAIPRAPERDVYPVSSIQRRIYATVARLTDNTVYNMVGGVWIDGALDVDRLAAAFEALVQRHEVLRTSFEIRGGELVQRIHPHVAAPIERRTVAAADDAPAAVAAVVRPFDLARPPLARLVVVEVGPRLRLLVLDVHHIIADGAAITVLVRELLAVYRGDDLAPLPVQAKDHTMWLQSDACRHVREAAATYWAQALGGGIAPLALQTDFPRSPAPRHRGARLGFALGPARHAGLMALARAHGATLFMTTLSVFGAFLGRLAGREDLVIGTPVDGRRHPGLQTVIGLLIHMLPLRVRPVGAHSFLDLLSQVRAMVALAFEHQALPVDDIADGLSVQAETGRQALFDVAFAFERADELAERMVDMPGAGWQLTPYAHATGSAKFDLTLTLTQERDDLRAVLEYDTDLFLPETAANLRDKLCVLIDAILRAPGAPLAELEFRTERELRLAQRVEVDFAF